MIVCLFFLLITLRMFLRVRKLFHKVYKGCFSLNIMSSYFARGLKGSTLMLFASVFASVFGYLSRAFLARILPIEEFGLFYATLTLIMFTNVFTDLGFGSALVKFIPEFQVKKQNKKIGESLYLVFIIKLILSILFATILILLASKLSVIYFKMDTSFIVLIIFAIFVLINSVNSFVQNVFQSTQRILSYALNHFLSKFLFFIGLILLVIFNRPLNVIGISLLFVGMTLISTIMFSTYLFKNIHFKKNFDKHLFKRLKSFAIPTTLTQISSTIIGYIDVIMITFLLSLTEVGIYDSVLPTALMCTFLSSAMIVPLFPLISEIFAKK